MAEKTSHEIKPGAIVELRSGGPPMTVREIVEDRVDCEWFKDTNLKKASFKPHSLQLSTRTKTHEERLEELSKMLRDDG